MPLGKLLPEQDSRADPEEIRLNRRDVDEFLGLCRAFCADGEISQAELKDISTWISNRGRIDTMPLVSDVQRLLDGLPNDVTAEARAVVYDVLRQLTGTMDSNGRLSPTTLPITEPPPALTFEGKRYCFTGTFKYGSRAACENAVRRRGGLIKRKITLNTDVLVVGSEATDTWLHSSYGLKISTAVRWRQNDKVDIPIVTEKHWEATLSQFPPTQTLTGADLEYHEDWIDQAFDLAAHGEISRDRFAEITEGLPFPEPEIRTATARAPSKEWTRNSTTDAWQVAATTAPKPRKSRYGWWVLLAFVLSYLFASAAFRNAGNGEAPVPTMPPAQTSEVVGTIPAAEKEGWPLRLTGEKVTPHTSGRSFG